MRVRDALMTAPVAMLMLIGQFKGARQLAWVPVDLTLLAVILTGVAMCIQIIASRAALPVPNGGMILLAAAAPGFFIGDPSPFTHTARLGVFLSGLTALAACWLLNTPGRRKAWLWTLVVMGSAVALMLSPGTLGTLSVNGGGGTIGAAQSLGTGLVVLLTLAMHGAFRSKLVLVVVLVVSAGLADRLIATGSRGPAGAVAIVLVLSAVLVRRSGWLKRTVLVGAVLWAGFRAIDALGVSGADRLRMALTGQIDNTATRSEIWRESLRAIPLHWVGTGWGNLWSILQEGAKLDSGYAQSEHNIVLSAFVEGGWVAGIAFVVFLVVALRRLWQRAADDPDSAAVFSVAVFLTVCAMVSGSVWDSRALFGALAVGFAMQATRSGSDLPAAAEPGQQRVQLSDR